MTPGAYLFAGALRLDPVTSIIIGVLAAVALLAFFLLPGLLVSYEVTSSEVRVLLFSRFAICRIPLSSIEEIRVCSQWEAWTMLSLDVRKLGNRPWAEEGVLIRTRSGTVLVTPRDHHRFVHGVEEAIEAHAGASSE
jgi:hypothetical protein